MNFNSIRQGTAVCKNTVCPTQFTNPTCTQPNRIKHARTGSLLPLQSLQTDGFRQSNCKKNYSSQSSPDYSILFVKKENLRAKRMETKRIVGERDCMVRKQKTDCINLAYMRTLLSRRRAIDWISYNISVGIYDLWNRTRYQLEYFRSLGRVPALYKQITHLCQQVKSLMQQCKLHIIVPNVEEVSSKSRQFKSRKLGNQQLRFSNLGKENISSHKYRSMRVSQYGQDMMGKKLTTSCNFPFSKLKTSINSLSSILCLMQRSITLDKENQLVREFLAHKKSNHLRLSPQQQQQLAQILSINERRCQIIGELVQKLVYLQKNHNNIVFTPEQIKRINEISLAEQLRTPINNNHPIEETVSKQLRVINSLFEQFQLQIPKQQIVEPQIQSRNAIEPFIKKRMETKPDKRVSIQTNTNTQSINYTNVASKISGYFKANKQHHQIRNSQRNSQIKHNIKMVKVSKEFTPSIQIKTSEKPAKTKKNIGFTGCIKDEDDQSIDRGMYRKTTSMKACKSNKAISWNQFEKDNKSSKRIISIKSLRSLRSMRSYKNMESVKTIGSQASSKHLRSLKTQQELKYLHPIKRQISCIRNYRDKMFRNSGEFAEQGNLEGSINLNIQQLPIDQDQDEQQQENNKITSIDDFPFPKNKSKHQTEEQQPQVEIPQQISIAEISKSKVMRFRPFRNSKRTYCVVGHPEEKNNVIREFLAGFKDIEGECNINKRKRIMQQQLERLYESKVVSQVEYERFKTYFAIHGPVERRLGKEGVDFVENYDDTRQNGPNPYLKLLQMRKVLELNTELNQTNKYYYNFHQFMGEQAQIFKTKRQNTKEEELFNIRTYVRQPKPFLIQRPDSSLFRKDSAKNCDLNQIGL